MRKFNVGDRVRLTDKCTYITCQVIAEDAVGEVIIVDGNDSARFPYVVKWGDRDFSLEEREITKASAIYLGGE